MNGNPCLLFDWFFLGSHEEKKRFQNDTISELNPFLKVSDDYVTIKKELCDLLLLHDLWTSSRFHL